MTATTKENRRRQATHPIERVGARVRGWSVGDRVGLHHHVPCLDCHFCRHRAFAQCDTYKRTGITAGFEPAGGGYAEYVRVMDFCLPGVVRIPARNSLEEGALLEPVNTVLKGIRSLPLLKGDTVWVAGAGPIGLLFIGMLSEMGMRVVATDLMESRRRLARRWGAWKALDGADVFLGVSAGKVPEEAMPINSTGITGRRILGSIRVTQAAPSSAPAIVAATPGAMSRQRSRPCLAYCTVAMVVPSDDWNLFVPRAA